MMKLNCSEGSPREQQLKGGMMTTGGVLCPKGVAQGAGSRTFHFVSAPLCGSPSGITQLIFTSLLTSDLAHPLNRPNGFLRFLLPSPKICSPLIPLPTSLSLFALRGLGRNSSTLGTREKAEGNRNKERQQRYFAGGWLGLCASTAEAHVQTQVQELRSQKL